MDAYADVIRMQAQARMRKLREESARYRLVRSFAPERDTRRERVARFIGRRRGPVTAISAPTPLPEAASQARGFDGKAA